MNKKLIEKISKEIAKEIYFRLLFEKYKREIERLRK